MKEILTKGHVKDIGSTWIYSPIGVGVRRSKVQDVHRDNPAPPSLRDSGALWGACRASPLRVCGSPLLIGGLMV
jgi:hypothetical protein